MTHDGIFARVSIIPLTTRGVPCDLCPDGRTTKHEAIAVVLYARCASCHACTLCLREIAETAEAFLLDVFKGTSLSTLEGRDHDAEDG